MKKILFIGTGSEKDTGFGFIDTSPYVKDGIVAASALLP